MKRIIFSALALSVALLVGACGSSSSSSTASTTASSNAGATTTTTTTTAAASSSAFVATATAALDAAYKNQYGAPPSSTPPVPKHETVWLIACSEEASGCQVPSLDAIQAMKSLGWTVKELDGQLTPSVYTADIREAIAAKVNAIVLDTINCPDAPAPMRAARAAGIKLVGLAAADCAGDPAFNAEALFKNSDKYVQMLGTVLPQSAADYVVSKTDGKANVIQMAEYDNLISKPAAGGFLSAIKSCTTCTVHTVVFTGKDLISNALEAATTAALIKYPTANVVVAPYDAAVTLGIAQAVKQQASRHIMLVGGEGLPANLALIRQGVQTSAPKALNDGWLAYATVDELIRVLDGQKPVDEGLWYTVVDKDHNLPASGSDIATGVDWQAQYEKDWGISK